MGAYLDRLRAEYDEITESNTAILNRAAEENREVSTEEKTIVERDDARRDQLEKSIEYYAERETKEAKVAAAVAKVPTVRPMVQRSVVEVVEPEYDIAREFPTIGDYAITYHRATALKERDAADKIQRAQDQINRDTAHQLMADNPGLIPTPILGPVINMLDSSRPFIQSITTKRLPAGKFDRPKITQHVAVGKQTAEKELTESQKLKIGTLPVVADTYAGHLNISRQDVKWSSPSIMTIVYLDFAQIYAIETCDDACQQFLASLDPRWTQDIATADAAGVSSAMYTAAAAALSRSDQLPDTQWVSPDVWAQLGGAVNAQTGMSQYPSLSLENTAGNPMGLKLVMDQHFPEGTWIIGPSRGLEWYEDVDGLMQVDEPDVLGQLVGYAGYGAYLNIAPEAFTKLTLPDAPPANGGGE